MLKYEVLNKITDKQDEQEKEKEKDATKAKKALTELEADARKDVLKNYDDGFKRMAKQKRMGSLRYKKSSR